LNKVIRVNIDVPIEAEFRKPWKSSIRLLIRDVVFHEIFFAESLVIWWEVEWSEFKSLVDCMQLKSLKWVRTFPLNILWFLISLFLWFLDLSDISQFTHTVINLQNY
jgi:hypothetical protein